MVIDLVNKWLNWKLKSGNLGSSREALLGQIAMDNMLSTRKFVTGPGMSCKSVNIKKITISVLRLLQELNESDFDRN